MRPADQPLRHRKARDRALILSVLGTVLLMPPIAGIFRLDAALAGVPLPVLYVFTVWAGLIASTAALSRRLSAAEAPADEAEDGAGADTGDDVGGRGPGPG